MKKLVLLAAVLLTVAACGGQSVPTPAQQLKAAVAEYRQANPTDTSPDADLESAMTKICAAIKADYTDPDAFRSWATQVVQVAGVDPVYFGFLAAAATDHICLGYSAWVDKVMSTTQNS